MTPGAWEVDPINRGHVSLVVLLLSLTGACDWLTGPGDRYEKPLETGDGWETATLDAVGIDPAPLVAMLERIDTTENHLVHSILIVKDGMLVLEEYWPGVDLEPDGLTPVAKDFDRETPHYVASVSKSLTSALAGIAWDQQRFGSVDDSIFTFFPEYAGLRTDDNAGITIAHLLAFNSGYDWNEFVYDFGDPRDSHYQMFDTSDPMAYLLGRPVHTEPGTQFHYNSGDTNILGEIVRRVSASATLVAFADRYLFGPLGAGTYAWLRFGRAPTITFASGGASLRPRDMAKFGLLYLNDGVWNGERILSAEWIAASTTPAMLFTGNYRSLYGYGYNWWLGRSQDGDHPVEYFMAAGWGGQYIYVYPTLDLVVVFTQGAYDDDGPLDTDDLLEFYILEAVG